jgi:transcriptional regulator with XRE-family HTH domain
VLIPPAGFDKQVNTAVGAELRRWRELHDLTLAEVADVLGIAVPTLSGYELGQKTMSCGRVAEICHALEAPIGEVMTASVAEVPASPRQRSTRREQIETARAGVMAAVTTLQRAQAYLDLVLNGRV